MTRMSRGALGLAVPLRAERGLAVFAERRQPLRDMRVDAEEPVVLPVVLVPVLQVQVVPERVLQVSVVPVPVVLVPVLVPVRHQSEAALGRPDLPGMWDLLHAFQEIMTELVTEATEYQITHWQVRAHHVVGWPRGLKLRPKVRGANLCRGTRLSTS